MNANNLIQDVNVSEAWVAAVKKILSGAGTEITPLIVTLTDFEETDSIREVLDSSLEKNRLGSVQTVSETIFPNSLYQLHGKDRKVFYERYLRNLIRIKKIDRNNSKGTYFERMIAFNDNGDKKINQLETIITDLKSRKIKRRSKLQISIFDPRVDHTNQPMQGFPCLQHVTFYLSENGGLIVNSFYAMQYLYQRGYGNWLGLINLGRFIANEVDIKFERFNCFVGVEKLDLNKTEAQNLIKKLK